MTQFAEASARLSIAGDRLESLIVSEYRADSSHKVLADVAANRRPEKRRMMTGAPKCESCRFRNYGVALESTGLIRERPAKSCDSLRELVSIYTERVEVVIRVNSRGPRRHADFSRIFSGAEGGTTRRQRWMHRRVHRTLFAAAAGTCPAVTVSATIKAIDNA